MAENYPVRIPGPETHRLADMGGVLQDLRWVVAACERLLPRLEKPNENTLELEALESSAIVRYCRCFSGGVRTAFLLDGNWLDKLPQDLKGAHSAAIARRDKHIAHSVNDWELNVVRAQLRIDTESKRKEVTSVSVEHHRVIGLAQPDVDALRRLALTMIELVRPTYEAERGRVLEFAKAIPVAELEKGLAEAAVVPGRVGRVDQARPR